MAKNIKEVFAQVASNLIVNEALIKRIHLFERGFTHRNQNHIEFFGGNLLGVEKVRFLPKDWNTLFDDVFQIDDYELERNLHSLPSVNKDHIVASDILNLTCVWLVHKIFNSTLSPVLKEQGMIDTLLILQYKVLTSKLARDFPFPANKELMTTVYATLSKKFYIKQYGSWSALLRARAMDVINPDSIHYDTIRVFEKDKAVQYMVTDIQGRIRDIVKNHWDTINKVKESDKLIATTSSTIETEEGTTMKDLQRGLVTYRTYIQSVAGEPSNFIKDELIKIIAAAMHTMSPVFLREALLYISENYGMDADGKIELMVNEVMVHAIEFLHTEYKGSMTTPNIALIISKLRGMYMSSRSTDAALLELRNLIDLVVMRKLKGRSPAAIAAVRVGVALYIVLRALTRKHFAA
jgi:hypothetical protein